MREVVQPGNARTFRGLGSCVSCLRLLFILNFEINLKHQSSNRQGVEVDKDIFHRSNGYFCVKRNLRSHVDTFPNELSARDLTALGLRCFLSRMGFANSRSYYVYAPLVI